MQSKIIAVLIKELTSRLIDDEKRENLVVGIIILTTIVVIFFAFIYYIITSPISAILDTVGADKNSDIAYILQDFKNENGVHIGDYDREIPLFFQFDPRWAKYPYAGTTIKVAGCGPTSLAMVVSGLKKDGNVTPLTMAQFSTSNGWAIDGMGSSWELMTTGARSFGLNAEQVSTSSESIFENLSQGKVMITSMTPGTFTISGHFIVLTGLDEDGMVKVNDSFSERLSNMVFPAQLISRESKGAWAFSYDDFSFDYGELEGVETLKD